MENLIKDIKAYLLNYGRPLELSLFKHFFEAANLDDVLENLKVFQNSDGGFGHGLEPDFLTPESSPIATWTAINILRSLEIKDHPLITQTIKYLIDCPYQKSGLYDGVIPSNNLYPHAPWWHDYGISEPSYNPTASLVGFIYKHLENESPYKPMVHHRVLKAIEYFLAHDVTEMHELRCFIELYHDISDMLEVSTFRQKLKEQILKIINPDASTWFNSYTVRPSQLIINPKTPGYNDAKSLIDLEHALLLSNRNSMGVWSITWDWSAQHPEAFETSKKAWQGINALHYLLRFKTFNFKG